LKKPRLNGGSNGRMDNSISKWGLKTILWEPHSTNTISNILIVGKVGVPPQENFEDLDYDINKVLPNPAAQPKKGKRGSRSHWANNRWRKKVKE